MTKLEHLCTWPRHFLHVCHLWRFRRFLIIGNTCMCSGAYHLHWQNWVQLVLPTYGNYWWMMFVWLAIDHPLIDTNRHFINWSIAFPMINFHNFWKWKAIDVESRQNQHMLFSADNRPVKPLALALQLYSVQNGTRKINNKELHVQPDKIRVKWTTVTLSSN